MNNYFLKIIYSLLVISLLTIAQAEAFIPISPQIEHLPVSHLDFKDQIPKLFLTVELSEAPLSSLNFHLASLAYQVAIEKVISGGPAEPTIGEITETIELIGSRIDGKKLAMANILLQSDIVPDEVFLTDWIETTLKVLTEEGYIFEPGINKSEMAEELSHKVREELAKGIFEDKLRIGGVTQLEVLLQDQRTEFIFTLHKDYKDFEKVRPILEEIIKNKKETEELIFIAEVGGFIPPEEFSFQSLYELWQKAQEDEQIYQELEDIFTQMMNDLKEQFGMIEQGKIPELKTNEFIQALYTFLVENRIKTIAEELDLESWILGQLSILATREAYSAFMRGEHNDYLKYLSLGVKFLTQADKRRDRNLVDQIKALQSKDRRVIVATVRGYFHYFILQNMIEQAQELLVMGEIDENFLPPAREVELMRINEQREEAALNFQERQALLKDYIWERLANRLETERIIKDNFLRFKAAWIFTQRWSEQDIYSLSAAYGHSPDEGESYITNWLFENLTQAEQKLFGF